MDKFADILQGLLDKLGFTVQYMWPKAVYYTIVSAITDMVGWGLFAIVLLFTSRYMLRVVHHRSDERCDESATAALHVTAIVTAVLAVFILLTAVTSGARDLLAPEWATIRGLITR